MNKCIFLIWEEKAAMGRGVLRELGEEHIFQALSSAVAEVPKATKPSEDYCVCTRLDGISIAPAA